MYKRNRAEENREKLRLPKSQVKNIYSFSGFRFLSFFFTCAVSFAVVLFINLS